MVFPCICQYLDKLSQQSLATAGVPAIIAGMKSSGTKLKDRAITTRVSLFVRTAALADERHKPFSPLMERR